MTTPLLHPILRRLQPGQSGSFILAGQLSTSLSQAVEALRVLNCAGDEPGRPCRSCRQFAAQTQTIITTLTPEDKASIGIEPVRRLIQTLSLAPANSRLTRAAIISPAGALTPEAQNALLKTLEEPPERTIMLLLTPQPLQLLETVRSRCPVINLSAASAAPVSANNPVEFLQASPFDRLILAKRLAEAKPEALDWAAGLQRQCLADAANVSAPALRRQMMALEQFRRQTAAGVGLRAAVELLALELPA